MYCLKCGKETQEEKVFCEHCLQIMEQYPVKPGTPAPLPHRNTATSQKKSPRRRSPTHEEQVRHLRRAVRILTVCLLAVSILLGFFAWQYFKPSEPEQPQKEIGQNYTVDSTTENKD